MSREDAPLDLLHPQHWKRPRGYAHCWRLRLSGAVAAIASAALVAVCAKPIAPGAFAQGAPPCAALAERSIEPALIGLPSGPARITSATVERLPASPAATEPTIAYCKVLGEIAPLDLAAPPIRFEVNLPEQWNGKAVQYGGGGLNGVLITGLAPLRDAPPNVPTPLAQGYVTLGTDSGHQVAVLPEIHAFGLNEEALINFAYASYKKVHDVAAEVARTAYGQNTSRFYFFGGRTRSIDDGSALPTGL